MKHDGKPTVNLAAQGERWKVIFDEVDAVVPIMSVVSLNDTASSVNFDRWSTSPQRETKGGLKRPGLIRKMRLFFFPSTRICNANCRHDRQLVRAGDGLPVVEIDYFCGERQESDTRVLLLGAIGQINTATSLVHHIAERS